jgi:hypothetical protein
MQVRKQKHLLVVTNPLGLVLATVDSNEIVFHDKSVTASELEYITWVSGCYDRLVECCCEE